MVTAPKNNEQESKPKPTLMPLDILMRYLPGAYEVGLKKYYRESWRKGFPLSVMFDAAFRHMIAYYYEREELDPQDGQHHLGAAIFSLLCILQTMETKPELDDRPNLKETTNE